jgi:hypothetical protein
MDLKHATELLDAKAQGRYFTEPYKLFGFTEETQLKDYLDFIIHEPVEWFKGLPGKLITRGSFAKPKTALINLLKEDEVNAVLDAEYIKKVHDIVWKTFKSHSDAIVEKRIALKNAAGSEATTVVNTVDAEDIPENVIEMADVESVHSVRLTRHVDDVSAPVSDWERRYRVLEAAYRELIVELGVYRPGLAASITHLLNGLGGPSSS